MKIFFYQKLLNSFIHTFVLRTQRIKFDRMQSSYCNISAGVPQGGVLSPLLFSIFINTLIQHIISSHRLYADDLQVFEIALFNDIPRAIDNINSNLQIINNWSKSFEPFVNPSKETIVSPPIIYIIMFA